MVSRVNYVKAKIKTVEMEQRQWAKMFNRAERGLIKCSKQLDVLKARLERELQLANAK